MIGDQIENLITSYGNITATDTKVDKKTESMANFEQNVGSISKNLMSGLIVKEKKLFRLPDGNYKAWVFIEASKEEIFGKAIQALKKSMLVEKDKETRARKEQAVIELEKEKAKSGR